MNIFRADNRLRKWTWTMKISSISSFLYSSFCNSSFSLQSEVNFYNLLGHLKRLDSKIRIKLH